MNPNLFRKLKTWRDATAKKDGVEFFRVLSNRTLEDVAIFEPKTREDLISIKGIKDKKYYKYGKEIIGIVKSESNKTTEENSQSFFKNIILPSKQNIFSDNDNFSINNEGGNIINKKEKIYTVSEFLDYLNEKLMVEELKVRGEITSVDEREKVIYFNLKDKYSESVLNCLIFKYQYEVSGVKLEIGNEIIVSGYVEIYKPSGRMSLKVNLIEVTGEGGLKKAYDELWEKFEKEGLFDLERKKVLPNLPETIGLITSSQGAAIGDFMTNLGNYGFKIKFINSSVEGKKAIFDLMKAIKQIKKMGDLDVLVIVRGGGSLESLQAFNNEKLVREIATLKIPVICGIGHEKDVSLSSLVCDFAVSTPTAAAITVRDSWDKAFSQLEQNQQFIISSFEGYIFNLKHNIEKSSHNLSNEFSNILQKFTDIKNSFLRTFESIDFLIDKINRTIHNSENLIYTNFNQKICNIQNKINFFKNIINANDPIRQLKLGYSIVLSRKKIIKSIKQVKVGGTVKIRLSDGEIKSKIIDLKK